MVRAHRVIGALIIGEPAPRDLSLCQHPSCYFSPSTRFEGVQTHRPKLFNSNWSSLKRVLDIILRLAREDGAESSSRINDWIAEQLLNTCLVRVQADSIIIKEMKRTKCAFVVSHDLAPEVLASDYIDARLDAIAEDSSQSVHTLGPEYIACTRVGVSRQTRLVIGSSYATDCALSSVD
ncbi:BQ5605_C009g05459 [Microbotryum silenes-dioicae]|uniref:BQ5605_C009g05459 protein n=1 Tax=Microbotryum silenes-dioicae TaxID=796604 RepID=A0A2X0PFD7_9BASI|nr:BQ5605_C009g05459 [Microbotryum silenes-dioicae]